MSNHDQDSPNIEELDAYVIKNMLQFFGFDYLAFGFKKNGKC